VTTYYRSLLGQGRGLAVVGVVGLAVLTIADPATNPLFPPCLWRATTGWLCPGCGSARAIHALMHGHLNVALHTNALAVAAMPVAASDLVRRLRSDRGLGTSWLQPVHVRALAVAIAAFGILRNISL
jgi:hypothetical protein